jgi:hypothetical protein
MAMQMDKKQSRETGHRKPIGNEEKKLSQAIFPSWKWSCMPQELLPFDCESGHVDGGIVNGGAPWLPCPVPTPFCSGAGGARCEAIPLINFK